jgi:RNA-directed DNA polymerase
MYPAKGRLKLIQDRIKSNILSRIELPEFVQGGVKKRDNLSNAKFHKGKLYKFATDLKKFYPTITSKKVFEMFRRIISHPTFLKFNQIDYL